MMLDEALFRGIEFSRVPTETAPLIEALNKKDDKKTQEALEELEKGFQRFFNKDYAPAVDRKIVAVTSAVSEKRMRAVPSGTVG